MKRLTKEHQKKRQEHSASVGDAFAKLEAAIEEHNASSLESWRKVQEAEQAYNDAIGEANMWIEDVQSDAQSYFAERSDKWQEGEAGQAYAAWIDEFRALDEVSLTEPDEVEVPDSAVDKIDELPEAPDA